MRVPSVLTSAARSAAIALIIVACGHSAHAPISDEDTTDGAAGTSSPDAGDADSGVVSDFCLALPEGGLVANCYCTKNTANSSATITCGGAICEENTAYVCEYDQTFTVFQNVPLAECTLCVENASRGRGGGEGADAGGFDAGDAMDDGAFDAGNGG